MDNQGKRLTITWYRAMGARRGQRGFALQVLIEIHRLQAEIFTKVAKEALPGDVGYDPPQLAEKILYFVLAKKARQSLPGDLQEEYRTIILPKFGKKYADLWYWKQVIFSIGPLLESLVRATIRTFVGKIRAL